MTEMIYHLSMSAFVDDENCQIVSNFAIVLFNTQAKALIHDVHIYTFRKFMLDTLLQHKNILMVFQERKT